MPFFVMEDLFPPKLPVSLQGDVGEVQIPEARDLLGGGGGGEDALFAWGRIGGGELWGCRRGGDGEAGDGWDDWDL